MYSSKLLKVTDDNVNFCYNRNEQRYWDTAVSRWWGRWGLFYACMGRMEPVQRYVRARPRLAPAAVRVARARLRRGLPRAAHRLQAVPWPEDALQVCANWSVI